jgi:iron complex outermembrane receptor protein
MGKQVCPAVRPRVDVSSETIAEVLRSRGSSGPLHLKASILSVSGGALLAAALVIAPPTRVSAQQQAQGQGLEEVTVTGSRIRRQDFTANAPITTVDQSQFQNTATVGVETVLNQLPQFVPAITQFTTTDVQQTANNTIGGSFVSLRGLGPNRNLVLIDGKRAQPANPQMYVDTNMIPAAAIQRVELITGGASAVYGADAVGGVVNFILKDDFEGASVQTRVGDTEHGGNQEILVSGLIGVNGAGDRGNVMLGLERATRSKVLQQDRDWRVDDMRNPATDATAFGWGSDPWFSSTIGITGLNALNIGNYPSQTFVNNMFNDPGVVPCTDNGTNFFGNAAGTCQQNAVGTNLGVPNNVRFLLNRATGTVYTGLMDSAGAAGSYRYDGPYNQTAFGNFQGLPYRVVQPDGTIKENNFWQWSTYPLERNSAFAKGHFDVSDNVRVTGQALFTRTHSQTSLGLSADNITFWGAPIPFGTNIYTGDAARGIPSSLNMDGTTNAAYLPGGRFGLNCDADGNPGCTEREAWPLPPEVVALYDSRTNNEADVWLSAPPDYLRETVGPRSGDITNTTSQLSIGAEGDFPSGNHHWDVTITSGYTDNLTVQKGSTRLSTYRAMMASPNFGRGFIGDPNPYIVGFAESIATCETGFPVVQIFQVSSDCLTAISPDLKNQEVLKQNVFEANLTGDLAEMKAGPLGYALGVDYREDSYSYEPDNLSQNQNFIDPIAGLFPNENSSGKYDVSELYGEMLIPIVNNGPTGVEHFNFELGGRLSDWSMPGVETLDSYKFLVDWGFTPKYRLRGGINRAHRAPNLGELFSARTQLFALGGGSFGDQCSQQNAAGPFSANPAVAGAAQAAQTLAICSTMMGVLGTTSYYGTPNPSVGTVVNTSQPTVGGVGIQNQLGNPNLREEDADTFTLGVVMNILDNWTLSVDYYTIEIKQMIALEGADSIYERCLSLNFNPTGDPNSAACQLIFRNPTNGNAANIDRIFSNEGRAEVEGVDLQLDWSTMLGGGQLSLNSVMNYNFASKTQDRSNLPTKDWAGTTGCALQIQCQGYDYRVFTTLNYFRGAWGISIRHQFWPSVLPAACADDPTAGPTSCANALATGGGVRENYQLFSLSGSYRIGDKYTIRVGVDNLLDEEPPLTGAEPNALPFAVPATHAGRGLGAGIGSTYDPLGRRGFISLTMDF